MFTHTLHIHHYPCLEHYKNITFIAEPMRHQRTYRSLWKKRIYKGLGRKRSWGGIRQSLFACRVYTNGRTQPTPDTRSVIQHMYGGYVNSDASTCTQRENCGLFLKTGILLIFCRSTYCTLCSLNGETDTIETNSIQLILFLYLDVAASLLSFTALFYMPKFYLFVYATFCIQSSNKIVNIFQKLSSHSQSKLAHFCMRLNQLRKQLFNLFVDILKLCF